MNEIWAPIKGYEGLYEVSSLGRVRSVDRSVCYTNSKGNTIEYIKPSQLLSGSTYDFARYPVVMLYRNGCRKTYKVHRLVANTFIPNPEHKPEVNHIDGDHTNNCVDNLEWVTGPENLAHAYSTGLSKVVKVRCINTGDEFETMSAAERYFSLGQGCIHHSLKTGSPTHGLTFVGI